MLLHKIITTQLNNISTQPRYAADIYEYFLSIKDTVNPNNLTLRGVYLASGTDLSGYLLSTNATESYFMDKGFYFGFCLDQAIYQKEFAEEYIEKYEIGFSRYIPYGNSHLTALIHEIRCLTIDPDSIQIKPGDYHLTLEFPWKHPMDAKTKEYKVHFLGIDLEKGVESFLFNTKGAFDFIYQKSAVNLSKSYQMIYPRLLDRIDEGGFIVKDRISCDGYKCFDIGLRNIFLLEKDFTRTRSQKLEEISRKIYQDKQKITDKSFERLYGWNLEVWKKNSNHTTPSEKKVSSSDFSFKKVSFIDSWHSDSTESLARELNELEVYSPTSDNRKMVVNYLFDLEKFPDSYEEYENLVNAVNDKVKEKFKNLSFKQFLSFEISKTYNTNKQYEMTVTLNIDDQLIQEIFVEKTITKQDLLILLDKDWLRDI